MGEQRIRKFGLIGHPLSHSFSPDFFEKKFKNERIENVTYNLFDLEDICSVSQIIADKNLEGFNVTIPYKQAIIPYLSYMSEIANAVNSVNVVKIQYGKLLGFNTDYLGLRNSLVPMLDSNHTSCLIFGSGGSSKTVAFLLRQLGIHYTIVSRKPENGSSTYNEITPEEISKHHLLINTTPVGMFPHIDEALSIPYDALTPEHLVYDLVYNPDPSLTLQRAKQVGAKIKSGLEMLQIQANESWKIWNWK